MYVSYNHALNLNYLGNIILMRMVRSKFDLMEKKLKKANFRNQGLRIEIGRRNWFQVCVF